ncbi:MAG TPA: ParA family partition ATPase [Stellaceae bacterium]|nr:ParA family partition ATPase [Stellaceae bacterium]
MSGKVITVAQQKGGAGKTTLAAHLALAWSAAGYRVAAIDIDPQGSLSLWHGIRETAKGSGATGLTLSTVTGWRTTGEVDRLKRDHDIVLIDSPPHAATDAKIAIRAAGLVVIPVQPSPLDVWASKPTLELAASEKVAVLLVLNRVPPRARLADDMAAALAEYGATIAKTRIGNRTALAASMAAGLSIDEMAANTPAAREVASLATEILRYAR